MWSRAVQARLGSPFATAAAVPARRDSCGTVRCAWHAALRWTRTYTAAEQKTGTRTGAGGYEEGSAARRESAENVVARYYRGDGEYLALDAERKGAGRSAAAGMSLSLNGAEETAEQQQRRQGEKEEKEEKKKSPGFDLQLDGSEGGGTASRRREDGYENKTRPDSAAARARGGTSKSAKEEAEWFWMLDVAKGGSASNKIRDKHGPDGDRQVSRKMVELELKWLKDPRALADRVLELLRRGSLLLAAELARTAQSEGRECVVAWNHILEYCMRKGNPLAAFRFYNDMKKRGRMPNDRTYTIMLGGLSRVDGVSTARRTAGVNPVKVAWSIYSSISAPNSKTPRSIIHTNAMLRACQLQGNMNKLWEVAGELPVEGPGAPDAVTYTIILTAIRERLVQDLAMMDSDSADRILRRTTQAVKEGKRVWTDVVLRWKKGDLVIDTQLVNAMARLLMQSQHARDWYDVLALFNQTAGVPIFVETPPAATPSLSNPKLNSTSSLRNKREELVEDPVPFVDEGAAILELSKTKPGSSANDIQDEEQDDDDGNFEGLFDPIVSVQEDSSVESGKIVSKHTTPTAHHIVPNNISLQAILGACQYMRRSIAAGRDYWHLFTGGGSHFRIDPNVQSFHQYLRLLRVTRTSRVALLVVRDQMVPAHAAKGVTFHLALSCARRDRQNPNVLQCANELLSIMNSYLALPDARALIGYLDLIDALLAKPAYLMLLNGLGSPNTRLKGKLSAAGPRLRHDLRLAAVTHLRPLVAKLDEAMMHGDSKSVRVRAKSKTKSSRWLDNFEPGNGSLCLTAMVRTRALVDAVLNSTHASASSLSETERSLLEQDRDRLKKYSSTDVAAKFKDARVHPSIGQVVAYVEEQDRKDHARRHEGAAGESTKDMEEDQAGS